MTEALHSAKNPSWFGLLKNPMPRSSEPRWTTNEATACITTDTSNRCMVSQRNRMP